MAAKKSSKVKDLPRKSVSSKKASNVKGGARARSAAPVSVEAPSISQEWS